MATLQELQTQAIEFVKVIRQSEKDSNVAQRELGSILHTVENSLKAYFQGKKVSERKARYAKWYTNTLRIDKFTVNNALGRHAVSITNGVRFEGKLNTAQVKELAPSARRKVQGKLLPKTERKAEVSEVWTNACETAKTKNPTGMELHAARVSLGLVKGRATSKGATFTQVLTLAGKMTSESIGSINEDQFAEWQAVVAMVETGFVNQEADKEEEEVA
jgi:hypothetical protein